MYTSALGGRLRGRGATTANGGSYKFIFRWREKVARKESLIVKFDKVFMDTMGGVFVYSLGGWLGRRW